MSDRTAYTALLHQVSNASGLPFALLEAQVLAESGGDPNALRYERDYFERYILGSPHAKAAAYGPLAACSFGLLQILLETAMEIGFTDRPERLFVPMVGLTFGAKQMANLWKAAGGLDSDYRIALAGYNGGSKMLTLAESSWPVPVQQYVSRVYAAVVS